MSTQNGDAPPRQSPAGYVPAQEASIVFIVLFGLSTAVHIIQTFVHRTWFLFPSVVFAGALETLGYGSRYWMSISPGSKAPFIVQAVVLIVGPTPLLAANFVIVGRMFLRLGEGYSRLIPTLYTKVFLTADIVALLLQAFGATQASIAVTNRKDPTTGRNIVLTGVIFQLTVIVTFIVLSSEFAWRFFKRSAIRPSNRGVVTRRMKFLIAALVVNTCALFIRAVFRTIEFVDGFTGTISKTEWMFNVFEGLMISIAIYSLNAGHPGLLLAHQKSQSDDQMELQPTQVAH